MPLIQFLLVVVASMALGVLLVVTLTRWAQATRCWICVNAPIAAWIEPESASRKIRPIGICPACALQVRKITERKEDHGPEPRD